LHRSRSVYLDTARVPNELAIPERLLSEPGLE
jgi:hypothetical protein